MAVIEFILRHPLALALGWALLHFLWQGLVVGLIAAALLHAARDARASLRYAIGVAAMAAMVLCVGATWMWLANRDTAVAQALQANETSTTLPTVAETPAAALVSPVANRGANPVRTVTSRPFGPLAMSVFLLLYGAGVVLLSIRLAGGWVMTRRLTRRSVKPAAHHLLVSAGLVAERLRIPGLIRIVESSIVSTPAIVGWIAPIVLLPASSLAGLSTIQVEALLAHEFAHIRRNDYLVNLVQSAIETLLFYHPAVWWVSRQVRIEREHCCDDVAVEACGDRIAYASALVDLETMRQSTFALAATDGSLVSRVRRILAAPPETKPTASGWMGVALVVAMAAVVPAAMSSARAAAAPPKTVSADQKAPPSSAASTPPAIAPAQANTQKPGPYLIRSSDTLHIVVDGEPTMTRNYAVQSDGVIVFPMMRPFKVVGMTTDSVAEAIIKGLSPGTSPEARDFMNASMVNSRLETFRIALDDATSLHSDAEEVVNRLSAYHVESPATNVETCGILNEPEVRSDGDVAAFLAMLHRDRQERANLINVKIRGVNHPDVVAVDARITDDLANARVAVTAIVDAAGKKETVAAGRAATAEQRFRTYSDLVAANAAPAHVAARVTVTVVKPQGKTVEVVPAIVTVATPQISAPQVVQSSFVLPILSVPQTAPVVKAPEPGPSMDYRLAPHDAIRIQVIGVEDLFAADARVIADDGTVSIYNSQSLRAVRVGGLTTHEAEALIAQALIKDGLLSNPQVAIHIDDVPRGKPEPVAAVPSTRLVSVTGEVGVPGQQHLGQPKVTLLQAISAAGGVTSRAARDIVIRRVDTMGVTREIHLGRDALMAGMIEDPTLEDGDAVFVPKQEIPATVAVVTVNGEVRTPKEAPWSDGMTVADALAACGGPTEHGAGNRATIQRRDAKTNKLTQVHVSQSQLMKTKLQPGDVVTVSRKYFG